MKQFYLELSGEQLKLMKEALIVKRDQIHQQIAKEMENKSAFDDLTPKANRLNNQFDEVEDMIRNIDSEIWGG